MRNSLITLSVCLLSLTIGASVVWAQMGGGRGMMMQPGQMQQSAPMPAQPAPGPGSAHGPGMMGAGGGMMGMGGAGGGMMGMGGAGGGMMGMMMSHMMGGGMMGGMMGMGGAGMMNLARMLPALNLSAQQWDKVRALAYKRLEKMAALRAKLFQSRLDLANLTGQKNLDAAMVKKIFARQAELKAEMFLLGWDYLQQLRKVLTPAQQKELKGQGRR